MTVDFLYAVFDTKASQYQNALRFSLSQQNIFLIPDVCLVEVSFLFERSGGLPAKVGFLRNFLNTKPILQAIEIEDLIRVQEILEQYPEANLDFVDGCIMAMSERLQITKICTFDYRDFSIFRPKHCDYLELFP